MDKLPRDFPVVDQTELKELTESLVEKGEDRGLRLFACWCARELDPYRGAWVQWIDAAEKFACGKINGVLTDTPEYEMSRNTSIGAWSIGWRNADPSAAACLAAGATLNVEASAAAVAAANWQRKYHILKGIQQGDSPEQVKAADRLLATRQVELLQQYTREYPATDLPGRVP